MGSFTPYPFQEEDVELIARQRGGLIGSEMGVGKTHEAIMLDQLWYPDTKKPTLVVAPLRTFPSWQEKYAWQAPDVDVVLINRKNREGFVRDIRRGRGDVFVVHWEALRLLRKDLSGISFGTVIADEVHRAANRKAQATQALKHIPAFHKLGMSGTASGDKPENLWSPLNWLWPKYYTAYWKFRKAYVLEEKVFRRDNTGNIVDTGYTKIIGPNMQNLPALRKEMAPWYVRHLKRGRCCPHHPDGVMPWLLPKTYETVYVDLEPNQRRVYDQMRKHMVAWVGEHEDSPLVASVVVAQLTRLSQIALGTPVVSEDGRVRLTEPSTKINAVVDILQDNPEKKFVVASSSKQICYVLQERLNREGIKSIVCSGDTPQSQQETMVKDFELGNAQVFIGVIAAMAEGIDGLQKACDTMIFMDRSWSTIKNMQCEDRLDRDGQPYGVEIIDIVARNTVDLGRRQKLEQKWSWIRTILGDIFDNVKELAA
jgi:SWI/SNF-related matrix-associated actin-dependent regulator 1 of chromatin subfamily A